MKPIAERIAEELNVRPAQVAAAIGLLDEGSTVPFIARYRKEATGALDDTELRTLETRLVYLRELEERRKTILESIREQGKLTRRSKPRSSRPTPRRGSKTFICRSSRSGAPRRRSPERTASSRSPTPCLRIPSASRSLRPKPS